MAKDFDLGAIRMRLEPLRSYLAQSQVLRDALVLLDELDRRDSAVQNRHCARFELCQDGDTGRKYWFGIEDGWSNSSEVGQNGILMLDHECFPVGTILHVSEPILVEEPNNA